MPRLPFSEPTDVDARRVWQVSELVDDARMTLESGYPAIWVRGEISGFRPSAPGHWYFDLKDDQARLPTVVFRGDNVTLPFRPEEGLEVTAFGRLSLYSGHGRFQLIANFLEPAGWGAQQLAFEQLKARLAAEGLFATARKRPLPRVPRSIGVVTSDHGAALQDMMRVWERRAVPARVILSPARVQGPGAASDIARALRRLVSARRPDVIIVGRGGGSREDLWAFNEELVARAIAECPVPVISAVGHEIDTTIADFVADARAATPTAAAQIVSLSREEIRQAAAERLARCRRVVRELAGTRRRRLDAPQVRDALARPTRALQGLQQRLDIAWRGVERGTRTAVAGATQRVERQRRAIERHTPARRIRATLARLRDAHAQATRALDGHHAHARERLATSMARVEAMSPLAVLRRGYALCETMDARLLRDAETVAEGDVLRVRLHRGALVCTVKERNVTSSAASRPGAGPEIPENTP